MTLKMTLVGAFLGAILFLSFLVLWFYRHKYSKQSKPKEVAVPLKVDRSALLADQRRQVALRRSGMADVSVTPQTRKANSGMSPPSVPESVPTEPVEEGFGEDLGAALSLASHADAKPKKSKSRFAALQDAADQFKDIYNRNNQL